MKAERLTKERIQEFRSYCKKFRNDVDDSFLTDQDLQNFQCNHENPTYLLNDEQGVVGAASLMIDDYFIRGKKGRFRIFHSTKNTVEAYGMLKDAMLTHTSEIDRFFLFLRGENQTGRQIFNKLGFKIERYSFVLDRPNKPVEKTDFPEGYELRNFEFNRDEEIWCAVRNEAFATLAGSETPLTVGQVKKMEAEDGYIEEGLKLLYFNDKPVGLLRLTEEQHEGENHLFIHQIAVLPSHQGKGLGRNLVRSGIQFGRKQGLFKSFLTVNAENEKAVNLYLAEGFQRNETVVCYNYNLK